MNSNNIKIQENKGYIIVFEDKRWYNIIAFLIRFFTKSKYSHIGYIYKNNNINYIFEFLRKDGYKITKLKDRLNLLNKKINYDIIEIPNIQHDNKKLDYYYKMNKNNIRYGILSAIGSVTLKSKYLKKLDNLLNKLASLNKKSSFCSKEVAIIILMMSNDNELCKRIKDLTADEITPSDLYNLIK